MNIKIELTQPTILALYNPTAETKISADASSHGLGAVLLQLNEFLWQPVAYASRALTDTERRYAQIEKEALAVTWGCERFSSYIIGKHVQIETISSTAKLQAIGESSATRCQISVVHDEI